MAENLSREELVEKAGAIVGPNFPVEDLISFFETEITLAKETGETAEMSDRLKKAWPFYTSPEVSNDEILELLMWMWSKDTPHAAMFSVKTVDNDTPIVNIKKLKSTVSLDVLNFAGGKVKSYGLENTGALAEKILVGIQPRSRDYLRSEEHPDGNVAYLRQCVAERVLIAQSFLPDHYRLKIVDAYRPLKAQMSMYIDTFYKNIRMHPDWDIREIKHKTDEVIAPPGINPPHATGSCADMTLADLEGNELDMGTKMQSLDPKDKEKVIATYPHLTPEQHGNRSLLFGVMSKAGLYMYPLEFWHGSYGDAIWAVSKGLEEAFHGSIFDFKGRVQIPL
jgi:D-alanyl-D-alanine dipeptidase